MQRIFLVALGMKSASQAPQEYGSTVLYRSPCLSFPREQTVRQPGSPSYMERRIPTASAATPMGPICPTKQPLDPFADGYEVLIFETIQKAMPSDRELLTSGARYAPSPLGPRTQG